MSSSKLTCIANFSTFKLKRRRSSNHGRQIVQFGLENVGLVRFRKGDIREILITVFNELFELRSAIAVMIETRQLTPEFNFIGQYLVSTTDSS